jgi:hypothetical protein
MLSLPDDIIFKIFFYIDDYDTILSYYLLNKYFFNNYMKRYTVVYKHRFKIIFKDIFSFLSSLPLLKPKDYDIHLLMSISSMCIDPRNRKCICNDYIFVYKMYKDLIYTESFRRLGINIATDLTNLILIQGPTHIDLNSKVLFNKELKNKIKVILPKEARILALNRSVPELYLRNLFNRLLDNDNFDLLEFLL